MTQSWCISLHPVINIGLDTNWSISPGGGSIHHAIVVLILLTFSWYSGFMRPSDSPTITRVWFVTQHPLCLFARISYRLQIYRVACMENVTRAKSEKWGKRMYLVDLWGLIRTGVNFEKYEVSFEIQFYLSYLSTLQLKSVSSLHLFKKIKCNIANY